MSERLAIANEVAWIKYSNQQPVRDPKREAAVLERLKTLAVQRGLNAASATHFFHAQITASRTQQQNDIRLWRAGGELPATPPRSLKDDIRPKIDAIDSSLIFALPGIEPPRAGLAAFANHTLRCARICHRAAHIASSALR